MIARYKMDSMPTKYRSILICLALTLATLVVFYQMHSFGFITFDDPDYIYNNLNIQTGVTLKAVKWALTAGYAHNWHPLTWISHMLDWQLFGNEAGGHHLTNLVFHIANTLLLFIVLKQMTSAFWQSAFVAALFALHPLHVESVAWVSERKDVLSTFFWILTMWAYLRYVKKPKVSSYLLIAVFFALGLMAKPMLVTLPFVLLLLDYWPLERLERRTIYRLILEKIPFFVLSAASSIVTFLIQRSSKAVASLDAFPLKLRICNALIAYLEYIKEMFWPDRLAFFYPISAQYVSVPRAVISAALLVAATVLVIRYAKNRRYLVTGWFWYLGTLVPVIGFVQVGAQAMADRYTYMTMTGLFIIIAWGLSEVLAEWAHRKIILWPASLTVLSALAMCTYLQTRYWKDAMTLCQRALKVTENNYTAHLSMTEPLIKQGRFEEAVWHNTQAVQIKPDSREALNNLGVSLYKAGKTDEAIGYFEKLLEMSPAYADAHLNIAVILTDKGDYAGAVERYRTALTINDVPSTHSELGFALLKLGLFEEAVVEYRKALPWMPNDPDVLNKLGYALAHTGKFDEAIPLYNKALHIAPDDINTHLNFGFALTGSGRFEEAEKEYEKILLLDPNNAVAHNDFAVALSRQGKLDEAVEYFTRALRIKPDYAAAHSNLGYTLALQGNLDQAVIHYSEALRLDPNYTVAHYELGRVLVRIGKINQSIGHFEDAMRLKPDWDEPVNILAWYFAVSKDTEIYNPDEAVRLALRACELTNNQKPDFLDTLAVAYAAKGDFGRAVETLEKALALCRLPQQESLKKELEGRLVLFKAGKPYVESR